MVTRTMKRPAPQRFFRKRASALIATLVTVALVAFVVGAMLLNVQHLSLIHI